LLTWRAPAADGRMRLQRLSRQPQACQQPSGQRRTLRAGQGARPGVAGRPAGSFGYSPPADRGL